MSTTLRIAAVQHDIVWEDPTATHALVAPMIATAASDGARLIVLTEMFATGFTMRPDGIAEAEDGPTLAFLRAQAALHDAWLCATIPTRWPARRPTNRLVVVAPDGAVHGYDKIHPFTYSGEDEIYDAGTEFLTVDVDGVRVTTFVCYDLRFADEFWATAHDTDLYVVPANWPAARAHHWRALLVARAIENQAWVVGVNRVGSGGGLDYVGDSMVIDPLGVIRATAHDSATVLGVDVDASMVAAVRDRFPFLRDRR